MRVASRILALALWVGVGTACAAVAESPGGPPADFVPEADRWVDVMEDVIGPIYENYLVREAERPDDALGFSAIAAQSIRAANHMALGYGIHELRDVPRYAHYARQAEAWFRAIAAAADRGDAATVRRLILDGEAEHCDRCHAAAG